MRAIAVIFSLFGFYSLLSLTDVEIYHFMPIGASGSERGLIDAAFASIFGSIASIIALLFSFLHFRRAQGADGSSSPTHPGRAFPTEVVEFPTRRPCD